jgi:isocitrate lyase
MAAYSALQEEELAAGGDGYRATRHQEFVGTEYFDEVTKVLSGGMASTLAMERSTEREQFAEARSSGRETRGAMPRASASRARTAT